MNTRTNDHTYDGVRWITSRLLCAGRPTAHPNPDGGLTINVALPALRPVLLNQRGQTYV